MELSKLSSEQIRGLPSPAQELLKRQQDVFIVAHKALESGEISRADAQEIVTSFKRECSSLTRQFRKILPRGEVVEAWRRTVKTQAAQLSSVVEEKRPQIRLEAEQAAKILDSLAALTVETTYKIFEMREGGASRRELRAVIADFSRRDAQLGLAFMRATNRLEPKLRRASRKQGPRKHRSWMLKRDESGSAVVWSQKARHAVTVGTHQKRVEQMRATAGIKEGDLLEPAQAELVQRSIRNGLMELNRLEGEAEQKLVAAVVGGGTQAELRAEFQMLVGRHTRIREKLAAQMEEIQPNIVGEAERVMSRQAFQAWYGGERNGSRDRMEWSPARFAADLKRSAVDWMQAMGAIIDRRS